MIPPFFLSVNPPVKFHLQKYSICKWILFYGGVVDNLFKGGCQMI